jgi:enoyl-CoA hydratase
MIETIEEGDVRVLKFAHGKVNAMNLEFCLELIERLDQASNDSTAALIIEGNGRVFSAGVDLKRLVDEDLDYLTQFLAALELMFEKSFLFRKPLVANVNGHAVAGGCVLACAADAKIAHDQARIGVPELRVGVPFPTLGLEIMRFATAPQYFRPMINIGATYSGDTALQSGLADEIVAADKMRDRSMELAQEMVLVPPKVFELTKRQLRLPALQNIKMGEEQFRKQIVDLWRSDEIRQAIRDYVEKSL